MTCSKYRRYLWAMINQDQEILAVINLALRLPVHIVLVLIRGKVFDYLAGGATFEIRKK